MVFGLIRPGMNERYYTFDTGTLTITSTKCQYMKYNTIVVKKKNKNKCISINDSF